jgi:unsaturated rhamnogalacturonyl hydrolase
MQKLISFVGCVCLAGTVLSQAAEPAEAVMRRVADHVLETTSFTVVNRDSGEHFPSTDGLAYSRSVAVESPYNQWEYWNGVLDLAMVRMGQELHNPRYADYSRRNMAFVFSNLPYFRRQYDEGVKDASFFQLLRMAKLDDCGAMAAGLADVYGLDPRPEYRAYLDRAADYILTKQSRLPDGTLVRPVPREMTLWADDLYMSVPFLARMGRLTGDDRYFADAFLQVQNFNKYLYDASTGLFFHCWHSDEKTNGVARWGRCNGWLMMAQVELLSHLPKDDLRRGELINLLRRQIVGVSRYQDQTGLWHQLLDKPDSYLESSCTAMFVYGIARAVNEGWISPGYLSVARNGWVGLSSKIDASGQVGDICIGTGINEDIKFYYTRPTRLNDIHGLGATLLAGIEMAKAERNPAFTTTNP